MPTSSDLREKPMDGGVAETAARSAFYERASAYDLAPLWKVLAGLVTPTPRPKALPHRWRYAEVRPFLMEACELVTAAEAERRVLILENPALRGQSRVADSLFAGLQIIRPGEVAPARHDSPHRGNRHLGFAETLVHEMPHTLAALETGALETGALSEGRARPHRHTGRPAVTPSNSPHPPAPPPPRRPHQHPDTPAPTPSSSPSSAAPAASVPTMGMRRRRSPSVGWPSTGRSAPPG